MLKVVPNAENTPVVNENDGLKELQAVTERTRTLDVTERIVAVSSGVEGVADGTQVELEKHVSVFIRPLPFRKWLDALGHMTNILAHLPTGDIDLSNEAQLAIWIMNLVGKVPEDILEVAALATEKDVTFFDRIDLDEGVKIILAVVEVNKDFFVQKVLPMFYEVAPQIKDAMAETFGPKA